jgi:predicted esterase
MMTKSGTYNQFGRNMNVDIYIDPNAKSKPAPGGPIVLYWHATGGNSSEVHRGFGDAAIQDVVNQGGVVAAFNTTACSGCTTTDDLVWYVEDDLIADQVVACSIQQANIDTRHIHAAGWSAGALHTIHLGLARSNYMASVVSYSGGSYILPTTVQDPSNHVSAVLTYGKQGTDVVVLDFHVQSVAYYNTYEPMGYYTMMCDHEMGHMIDPNVMPHVEQFFEDHPYKVSPEPYSPTIPAGWPTYCKNMP